MKHLALTIICFLICCKIIYAQSSDSIFVPMPVVIFQDDFQSDSTGTFPSHWRISHKDSAQNKRLCKVRNVRGKKAMVFTNDMKNSTNISLLGQPGPKMAHEAYLPERFTLECDFLIPIHCAMSLDFYSTHAATVFDVYVEDGSLRYVNFENNAEYASHEDRTFPPYHKNDWHHFALSYTGHQATCYIDGKEIYKSPVEFRDPLKFFPGWANVLHDSIAYANFRLATDSNTTTEFDRLITENRLTTHAILFDVNTATVQKQSIAYVKQLAAWLKVNPKTKLEIDGHTDSDGEPAANMILSQKRADAVKQLLVSFGIPGSRLTTKGYGDTKPIKPNTTPEGKADNRRVEFISK